MNKRCLGPAEGGTCTHCVRPPPPTHTTHPPHLPFHIGVFLLFLMPVPCTPPGAEKKARASPPAPALPPAPAPALPPAPAPAPPPAPAPADPPAPAVVLRQDWACFELGFPLPPGAPYPYPRIPGLVPSPGFAQLLPDLDFYQSWGRCLFKMRRVADRRDFERQQLHELERVPARRERNPARIGQLRKWLREQDDFMALLEIERQSCLDYERGLGVTSNMAETPPLSPLRWSLPVQQLGCIYPDLNPY